ncbi:trypsin-like serine protease [Aquincola agrisoli]
MPLRCRAPLRLALSMALAGAAGQAAAIVGGTSTTAFGQVDSGVQITGNWVLTATHVAYGVGSLYGNGYGSASVAAVYHFGEAGFPADDLTLLRLATAIDAPALALEGTVLAPDTLSAPIAVTIATGSNQWPRGYGATWLQDVWPAFDADGSGPQPAATTNWLITATATLGEPYVQPGDSGGGLFLGHVSDSSSTLLGITSAAVTFDNGLHASAFVQLASYRAWIDATMAADPADHQQALWVSSVPEPASCALLLAGIAVLPALRKRAGHPTPARPAC